MSRLRQKSVGVRLEGGLGDHILGMRVLPVIRERYPEHNIIVYSDGHGSLAKVQLAAMSPLVARVVPVFHVGPLVVAPDTFPLETLRAEDRELIAAADLFIEGSVRTLFAAAAVSLDVPLFEILRRRPELRVPIGDGARAASLLARHGESAFIGVHFAKYGGRAVSTYLPLLEHILRHLLRQRNVVVLNFLESQYDHPHWPEEARATKAQTSREEAACLERLCELDVRVVPCIDLPLMTVAALLERCRYFVGMDNGVKHLAWALGIPLTYFCLEKPGLLSVLRWLPDVNRMLLLDCRESELNRHLAEADMHTAR